MNFLLDENFPKSVVGYLEEAGHRVFDYREIGAEGGSDELVLQAAISRSAVLLSTDRDFFHTLCRVADHCGIVVIALRKPTRSAIMERLLWFIEKFPPDRIVGRAFQLRNQAWLVYPSFDD